ncbi:MAG: GxxExxY protein [Rhodospirillales bacterium]
MREEGKAAVLTRSILSAAFEVSNTLGSGFLEKVYQRALLIELSGRGLSALREVEFPVFYKEREIGRYVSDLVVEDCVIVEVKAVSDLNDAHLGQVVNYLKASGLKVGLLVNFGQPRVQYRRVVV